VGDAYRDPIGPGQTEVMQNSQLSGAKGFAILVLAMVGIILVIMAIAFALAPG
jgi:hypothetical protein